MPNLYINSLPIRDDTLDNPYCNPKGCLIDNSGSATDNLPGGSPFPDARWQGIYQRARTCIVESRAAAVLASGWQPDLRKLIEPRPNEGYWLVTIPFPVVGYISPGVNNYIPAHRQKVYAVPIVCTMDPTAPAAALDLILTATQQATHQQVAPGGNIDFYQLSKVVTGVQFVGIMGGITPASIKAHTARGYKGTFGSRVGGGGHAVAMVGLQSPDPLGPLTAADRIIIKDPSGSDYTLTPDEIVQRADSYSIDFFAHCRMGNYTDPLINPATFESCNGDINVPGAYYDDQVQFNNVHLWQMHKPDGYVGTIDGDFDGDYRKTLADLEFVHNRGWRGSDAPVPTHPAMA